MAKNVKVLRQVVDSVLSYARMCHPKESILLLKGKTRKERIVVEEVLIPPFAVRGRGFSNFPLYSLPIDFSIVGSVHSHPSGILRPSITDLNHIYGVLMMITSYPYGSERNIAIFNRDGKSIPFDIIAEQK